VCGRERDWVGEIERFRRFRRFRRFNRFNGFNGFKRFRGSRSSRRDPSRLWPLTTGASEASAGSVVGVGPHDNQEMLTPTPTQPELAARR
jgi:hypothetical protein